MSLRSRWVWGCSAAIGFVLLLCAPVLHTDHGSPRMREAVLLTDLRTFREVIGQFNADRGCRPTRLAELVERGYLRQIPKDPFTKRSDTWRPVYRMLNGNRVIVNIRSGAEGIAPDGRPFSGL